MVIMKETINKNRDKGFTIVELVIVIAVIAILAAVLVPTFSNVVENANVSSDKSLVRNINNVLEIKGSLNQLPNDKTELRQVLKEYGINETKNKANNHIIFWSKAQNMFFIWGIKEQEIIFPEYCRGMNLDDFDDEVNMSQNIVNNLVSVAEDYMFNYCLGFKNNHRLGEYKIVDNAVEYVATGAMKINYTVNQNFNIYIYGALFDGLDFSAINLFNENYKVWNHNNRIGENFDNGVDLDFGLKIYELSKNYYKIECVDFEQFKNIAYYNGQYVNVYFAISLLGEGKNLVVSFNEEILNID